MPSTLSQKQRFKYFLGGAVVCIVALYFIFQQGTGHSSWLPNGKVLERLHATYQNTESANCIMRCYNFGGTELENLYMYGDVDFETKVVSDQSNYEIRYEIVAPNKDGREVRLTFDMFKDYAHLRGGRYEDGAENDCGC